ncbi:ATP-binding protein [Amphibacillus xylanus]|uniref:histidine kinase n=1 Tax=Amphibacillus xylanus (strain ATCC 51415 / DSM 6626 / JCM 7361 / LMG 17667 / NBRC 15112 / Ep01) TaxID=698758 RepID=K0IZM2_AMPXN|nr:ATP-binding protein [Amphibacillus xylanus]BAM47954.1 putative two-component system sensor kinase/response regulator [Amphibacillus xylanus NBRC 15112]
MYNRIEVEIKDGHLDLQTTDLSDDMIMLDGEWEFYPSTFIANDIQLTGQSCEIISVPDGWQDHLNSPFGYGSYRLKIRVDPNQNETYGLYVTSIRSSYDVYVNGEKLTSSGITATTKQNYHAKNLPKLVVFEADDQGLIEIIIQAANYNDIRDGGIIRSIKFGTEHAVRKLVQLSSYAQVILFVLFLSHSLYALVFYFLGKRNKRLLYFSLFTFCFSLYSLLSTGDKIFHQFFYIGYDWDFRLTNMVGLLAWYALLQSTDHKSLPVWEKLFPYYQRLVWMLVMVTLFIPAAIITRLFFIYASIALVALIVALFSIVRDYRQDTKSNLLTVLGFVAVIHHFIWVQIWIEFGVYLPYYPVDLIVAVTLYTIEWFGQYFETYKETKALAVRLQQINQEKDEFLATTSHEFRTPLNSILLLTKAVHDRDIDTLSLQSINELTLISDIGKKMSFLLDDLLAIKQLENHQPRLNKQVVRLEPLVTGVIDLLNFSIEIKPFELENQISDRFPAVYADENRLTQIFLNLISNAIKYTDNGRITISASVKDRNAEINVTDTGIGISPELQKKIFLPYQQGDTVRQMRDGGFGLGLSIVKELVELHGGKIFVDSIEGSGTTFTFTLPLAAVEEKVVHSNKLTADLTKLKQFNQPESTKKVGLPAILIVDDNPTSLIAIKSILPDEEYDAVLVSSAHQALEQLKKRNWDLVLSDIMMPEISGYQLTKIIREQYSLSELPVLLLSVGNTNIKACFASGANDYIRKPVEPVELKARLDSLISLKRGVEQQLDLETAWLQAQIQPHFLFNTLNSIKALSEWNTEEMQTLLDHFSYYLRNKFKFQRMRALVPLEEELNLVRSYLYIEQVRFQENLRIEWQLDDLTGVFIPFITIQPLVENAIHHGIRKKQGKGTISIRFINNMSTSKATITVSDDGVGIEQTKLAKLLTGKPGDESGIGILNVNQRLKQLYGTGLIIESSVNQGTTVSFEIDLTVN